MGRWPGRVDQSRIVYAGHSAAGHLALWPRCGIGSRRRWSWLTATGTTGCRWRNRAGTLTACRLVELPGTDHFALIDPESAVWPQVLEALRSLID